MPKPIAERKVKHDKYESNIYFYMIFYKKKKQWQKFGESKNDAPGVNSATTVVSDEVFMQFLNNTVVLKNFNISKEYDI